MRGELLISIIMNLFVTLFVYGGLVIGFCYLRKKPITTKRYRNYCILACIGGYLFFAIMHLVLETGENANHIAAVIWGMCFYKKGINLLEKKGRLVSEEEYEEMKKQAAIPNEMPQITGEESEEELFKKLLLASVVGTKQAKEANAKFQPNFEKDEGYGFSPDMPIFTTSIHQQEEYLRSLRTENGDFISWKRTGSYSMSNINGMVDEYEIFDCSGLFITKIYINMYGAENSQSAPQGFMLNNENTKLILKLKENKEIPQIRFCRQCGAGLDTSAKFCRKCGCMVVSADSVAENTVDKFREACAYIETCVQNQSPKIRRAFLFLDDEEWQKANEYFEAVLDEEPENALCYLGEAMTDVRIQQVADLRGQNLAENKNYRKFLKFADGQLRENLEVILNGKVEEDVL